MNNLSIASVIEKNRVNSENAIVFTLDITVVDPLNGEEVGELHLTNYTTDLATLGVNYVRFPFEIDLKDESGEIQNLQLIIQDQAGLVHPYLRQYRGGVGSSVMVSIVTVTPEHEVAKVDFAEIFEVISSSSSDFAITFELGAENPLTRMCPRRTQMRSRCSFKYKSTECGYTGALPTCDLTLDGQNGCKAHDNSPRFGGFPSIVPQRM